jgi:hypothetical protein
MAVYGVTDNNGYFINILLISYVTYFIHILFIFYSYFIHILRVKGLGIIISVELGFRNRAPVWHGYFPPRLADRWQTGGGQVADRWQTGGRQVVDRWWIGGRQVADRWQTGGRQVADRWRAGGGQVADRWRASGILLIF